MAALTFTNRLWIFLIVLTFSSCGNSEKRIEKAKQIEKGMTKKEVLEIMGNPKSIDSVKAFAPYVECYYYKVYLVEVFSDPVIVWFDSTGRVGQVTYPKGTSEK